MNDPENRAVDILRELGARPAAPFFEEGPARFVRATLDQLGVDHEVDAYGNIIARYELDSDRAEPPVAFVAHMDHPGFEITEANSARVVARALGGVRWRPYISLRLCVCWPTTARPSPAGRRRWGPTSDARTPIAWSR